MRKKLITIPKSVKVRPLQISSSDDEFDAIAIGLTHFAIHR